MNDFIKADKIIEKNRYKNLEELKLKEEEVKSDIYEYEILTNKIKLLNISLMNNIKIGNKEKQEEIETEIKNLKSDRAKLLIDNGYDEDYLVLKYNCHICKDTGEINGRICNCKRDIINKIRLNRAKMYQAIDRETFENFDFNIFRNEKKEDEGLSPRELMEIYFGIFKEYAENFSLNSNSLYISGSVGVGKTYICNSISSEVIKRGYNVVYMTASSLMQQLKLYLYSSFEREVENEEKYNLLIEADLLIIDDLGTENITDTSVSNFFNLINNRIIKNKPVIISTNIPIEEIPRLYDERIASRLKNFEFHAIFGDDLRGIN